jgi:hypothetical protein
MNDDYPAVWCDKLGIVHYNWPKLAKLLFNTQPLPPGTIAEFPLDIFRYSN